MILQNENARLAGPYVVLESLIEAEEKNMERQFKERGAARLNRANLISRE